MLSLWEHIEDLRKALLRIFFIVLAGVIVSLIFYEPLIKFITQPVQHTESNYSYRKHTLLKQEIKKDRLVNPESSSIHFFLPENTTIAHPLPEGIKKLEDGAYLIPSKHFIDIETVVPTQKLMVFGPIEGTMTALKIAVWVGIAITCPLWLFFALQFILPALHGHEKKLIAPFIILSLVFMSLGACFAYFVTIPIANKALFLFNNEIGQNLWSLSAYLDYTLILLLSHSLAFELFLILLGLIHFGIITKDHLIKKRRHAIVVAFILGAIFTPPDIFTQFLMAIPLIGFFELSIFYSKLRFSFLPQNKL